MEATAPPLAPSGLTSVEVRKCLELLVGSGPAGLNGKIHLINRAYTVFSAGVY